VSSTQSNESADRAPIPSGIDVVEVTGTSIGNLSYTTKLIFERTAGLVGGSVLPERPPVIEVKEHGPGKLAIIIHNELHDNLRSLLANTSLGRLMDRLYTDCYNDLYLGSIEKISSTHELQLTVEQSAQFSQALLLLALNYSNTPL